jgi:uncharacterized membrane protein
MILSASFTAVGQAFWKLSSNGFQSWQLYIGFLCYGIGAILMIIAFRFGSLSVLHPLLSIGYVIAILIEVFFLSEKLTLVKIMGNVLIISGAIFIGVGGKSESVKSESVNK